MTNELTHHGILGMKWGRRRFQNSDGSLTDAGKKRYYKQDRKWEKSAKSIKTMVNVYNNAANKDNAQLKEFNSRYTKYDDKYYSDYQKHWNKLLQESADEIIGNNPSGTKKAKAYAVELGGLPIIELQDISERSKKLLK